ncbi:MAG: glutamate racemase [Clostridia bacterium]|nr:glutamate racemase [Clostridia bacterium]
MTSNDRPIAVIDSGIGGVSVLKELIKLMPNENYIYLADEKNAPYGTKTMEEVRNITVDNVKMLFEMGAKALVVACNTATGAAVRYLRETYPDVPIVGIEPAVKPAKEEKENPTVLVMATPLTLNQEKFENLLHRFSDGATIIPLGCPGLMEIIEDGDFEGERIDNYLNELFKNIDKSQIDSVVLGCTHYPHAKEAIKKAFCDRVHVFDGGYGTAKEALRRIKEANLLNDSSEKGTLTLLCSEQKKERIKKMLEA